MPRDAIAEWMRALMRRSAAYSAFTETQGFRVPVPQPPGAGGIAVRPFDLSNTRPLARVPNIADGHRSDLAQAIRLLQRNNRLLRSKFGLGWADATNFVLGEAQRRSVPTASLARALTVQLRTEAT